jgi:hypothetical protein
MFPTLAITLALALLATVAGRRAPPSRALTAVAVLIALTATANVAYYAHRFDDLPGYFRYRTWWWADYVPALSGLLVGCCLRIGHRIWRWAATAAAVVLACSAILGPWAKPLLMPLEPLDPAGRWEDGICIQTTYSTCGPCALTNLLHRHGLATSERDLAAEAMTSGTSTELWYLARCAERRGFPTSFVAGDAALQPDAILGKGSVGAGHFVAITRAADGTLSLADSVAGASHMTLAQARRLVGTPGMSLLVHDLPPLVTPPP